MSWSVVENPDEQVDALVDALRSLGTGATVRRRPRSVVVRFPERDPFDIAVAALSTVRPGAAATVGPERPLVVVADRVPAAQRRELDRAGVGWLDRRGHLKLSHDGVWIDADVPSSAFAARGIATDRLGGPVAMGVALAALLAYPQPAAGVRELARRLEASPGGVSQATRRLVDAGLLTRDRRAAVPGLFWVVTESWSPKWQPLSSVPAPEPGLLAVGTRAAVALGAPVLTSRGQLLDLIAVDRAQHRRILRTSQGDGPPVARVALAPGGGDLIAQTGELVDGHRVAAPVVVATSIAGDPARGAEIVERWELADRAW